MIFILYNEQSEEAVGVSTTSKEEINQEINPVPTSEADIDVSQLPQSTDKTTEVIDTALKDLTPR